MNRFLFKRWRREYSTQQIKVFPLVFRNPEMEEAFHNDTTQRDVEQLRFSSIVAMFAYGIFILVDVFLFPPAETRRLLLLRLIGEVVFLGAIAFTFIHNQELKKRFSLVSAITVVLVGVTVLLMILSVTTQVRHHYYVGVIFTIIFGYGLMPSRFTPIAIAGTTLTLAYFVVSMFFAHFDFRLIMISNMFVMSINLAGIMVVYNLEFQRRADYFIRMDLKESREQLAKLNEELEQRVSQRTREVENSNKDLQDFVYVISHDLKEPLRQVSGYVSLIERRYAEQLDEAGKEFIDFAVDGASRMAMMIDRLLAFSRLETQGKELVPVDCNEVIDKTLQVLDRLLKESGARVDVAPLPVVLGDDSQLLQLFQNLISNSIKYAGERPPEIEISAEYIEDTQKWQFEVRDQGIGIDPDDLDYIFILFKRARNVPAHIEGSGVGLSICKRIVERHGGNIRVESVLDEGAAFYFTLFCGEMAKAA